MGHKLIAQPASQQILPEQDAKSTESGYLLRLDIEALEKKGGQRQQSLGEDHDTLLFTHEGHIYTKA